MRIRIITAVPTAEKKKRVCAYARVSTDSRRQEESLENQTATYERLIRSNPEYAFAGVYADQGISGYCENRPQFQKMLERARAGEIDLIITKSISRFARNTVTVLKAARELKELGVGIFFEEQKINTLSGDGEMMLAVLASFAQEESRSMSENNKWSIKKKFERGEVMITTSRFYGMTGIVQVISPMCEPLFSEWSYGFRPNRSCEMAIRQLLLYLNDGYEWIVDIDLEKFFDNVPQDKLMSLVHKIINDSDTESLIRKYLKAGVMTPQGYAEIKLGTPQGGNLSPLL